MICSRRNSSIPFLIPENFSFTFIRQTSRKLPLFKKVAVYEKERNKNLQESDFLIVKIFCKLVVYSMGNSRFIVLAELSMRFPELGGANNPLTTSHLQS